MAIDDDTAEDIKVIHKVLEEFFKDEPEKAQWWLMEENPNFGNLRPHDLILAGRTTHLRRFCEEAQMANRSGAEWRPEWVAELDRCFAHWKALEKKS